MANLSNLHKVLAVLDGMGLGDEYVCAEHDIIYLPLHDRSEVTEAEFKILEDLGCHWDSESGGLAFYV
jgi:diadenosine tetraphosphatase ApaH/serine/threonine PP2A family protein phosphatase